MAEIKTLAATVRDGLGKGASRSVRREGKLPAVIYGGGEPATSIALDYRELNKLIYAGHFLTTIFDIEIDGQKQRVIPRDYQLDRVRDTPLHIDFFRLKAGSSVKIEVPLHFINQDICPGIKKGGSLNVVLHKLELRVPADAIPESITIDLAQTEIAETIHLSKLELPAGCKPVNAKRDNTIANIVPPVVVEESPAAAAAAPAKGKKK
jgi:large subunit ribosomal protein L25